MYAMRGLVKMSDVLIVKNLNRWFKEKWVDVSRKDPKTGKHPPCGRSKAKKGSKGYPKCRPSVRVSSKTPKTSGEMTSGQKRAATKRKRSKKQGVGGKPTIVKEDFEPMNIAMRLLKEARPHALIPNFDLRHMLNPKSDIQEELLMQHVPHALSNDESATEVYNQLMQEAKIREEETDYFPLPQTQIEDYGEQHPPIFRYNATNAVTYRPDFQDIYTGEPMNIAMRLLKAPRIPRKKGQPAGSKKHSDLYTDENPKGTIHGLGFKNPAKARQSVSKIKNSSRSHAHKTQAAIAMEQRAREMGKKQEAGVYRNFIEQQKKKTTQMKKSPVSPEAKRHKIEYDKKYESSPERVKYREELNRERRKRGIYGQGGPDMSHTKDHTLVAESPHANRARHFKERGTLKSEAVLVTR